MRLWDWIVEWLLPLFGEIPTASINLGNFGMLTITEILAIMFWVSLGYVICNVLVLLPYRWIMRLLKGKGWIK